MKYFLFSAKLKQDHRQFNVVFPGCLGDSKRGEMKDTVFKMEQPWGATAGIMTMTSVFLTSWLKFSRRAVQVKGYFFLTTIN